MKVIVTVTVEHGDSPIQPRTGSMTLRVGSAHPAPDVVVANAARCLARNLGLGEPTPRSEGGRGA